MSNLVKTLGVKKYYKNTEVLYSKLSSYFFYLTKISRVMIINLDHPLEFF